MKQHEREFFIYKIRSGKIFLPNNLVIHPPTIEQSVLACMHYDKSFSEAFDDEIMTEEEMLDWMKTQSLWSDEDEEKIKGIQKDIEKLKKEIYNARNNELLAEKIRLYIRAGEKQLSNITVRKNKYYQNTCEGIANTDKISFLMQRTTYRDNALCDPEDIDISEVVTYWQKDMLPEHKLRDIARNEPWRSIWSIKDSARIKLFCNKDDEELTFNQKSLVIWSQMYDNIQESVDCPTKRVIDDDDMLDGWFIIQSEKRDQERSDQEFDNSVGEKVKNSSEIFMTPNTEADKKWIENMNSLESKMIKKERAAVIQEKGTVSQADFKDEQRKFVQQQNELYKGKFKGG